MPLSVPPHDIKDKRAMMLSQWQESIARIHLGELLQHGPSMLTHAYRPETDLRVVWTATKENKIGVLYQIWYEWFREVVERNHIGVEPNKDIILR
jgi:hypothetical protein